MTMNQIPRRVALWKCGGGLGGLALAAMLDRDRAFAADSTVTTVARARGGVIDAQYAWRDIHSDITGDIP